MKAISSVNSISLRLSMSSISSISSNKCVTSMSSKKSRFARNAMALSSLSVQRGLVRSVGREGVNVRASDRLLKDTSCRGHITEKKQQKQVAAKKSLLPARPEQEDRFPGSEQCSQWPAGSLLKVHGFSS